MYRVINHCALSRRVLAVAATDNWEWAAFIDAVPGSHHESETSMVLEKGTKLPEAVAAVLFPHEAKLYKWRD